MQVQLLGWEDPLEQEMATHFSILVWRIPWTEEPGRSSEKALAHGVKKKVRNTNDMAVQQISLHLPFSCYSPRICHTPENPDFSCYGIV